MPCSFSASGSVAEGSGLPFSLLGGFAKGTSAGRSGLEDPPFDDVEVSILDVVGELGAALDVVGGFDGEAARGAGGSTDTGFDEVEVEDAIGGLGGGFLLGLRR